MVDASSTEFLASLSRERDVFRQFLEILEGEQEALVHGKVDQLQDLAQTKSGKVLELVQLAEARNRFLTGNGLPADQAGISAWLAALGAAPEAQEAGRIWDELVAVAMAARQLNETNGAMINLQLQHNQQALAVLMSAANQATLYGPDGQHLSGGGGRHFDKA